MWADIEAGLWRPQVQIQITPLCWGVGGALTKHRIAIRLGPIAVCIWFWPFETYVGELASISYGMHEGDEIYKTVKVKR